MPLVDVHIDEIVLAVPGLPKSLGERLGQLLRDRLALYTATGEVPAHVGALVLRIDPPAARSLEDIADQIVGQLALELGLATPKRPGGG